MKLLLINASPHGENSKTLLLARRFIRGLTQNPAIPLERDTFRSYHLQSMNIQECNAYHCCWQDEENFACRIQGDDMNEILSDYRRADLVVWSFPLMFYHFPAAMKRMQERLFVMLSPELVRNQAGYTVHPIGAKFFSSPNRREVFISTAAFPTVVHNYEGVQAVLRMLYEDRADEIFMPQSTLFNQPIMKRKIARYLDLVESAGAVYSMTNGIDARHRARLQELLLDEDFYIQESNRQNEKTVDSY